MKFLRREFMLLAGSAAALPAASRLAWALDYPSRQVHLIVGFPAGNASDILARLVGQSVSERLGQQFIIENRPGAGSNVGTETVVKAPPDGYTLLLVTPSNAINTSLYEKLNFNFIRDIAPVASVVSSPYVVAVNPSLSAHTVPEFIAYAKANPGKINMASTGIGTSTHIFGELFQMMTGINMVHVPYRGNFVPDLIGGQVQVVFAPITHLIEYIRADSYAPSQSPPRRARKRCRTYRPWPNSSRATRRAVGMASVHPSKHPPRSSKSSTVRSTPLLPIPSLERDLPIWAQWRCR